MLVCVSVRKINKNIFSFISSLWDTKIPFFIELPPYARSYSAPN